jgi:hypothetical protein
LKLVLAVPEGPDPVVVAPAEAVIAEFTVKLTVVVVAATNP